MKVIVILSIAGLLASCGREHVAAANNNVRLEPAPEPNSFEVGKADAFEFITAATERVRDDLQANGVVAPDVSRTVPITALAGGRVVEINARLGDDVRQGQVLLKISSNDLAGAYADYRKALSDELLSRKMLDRARALLEHGAVAQKEVEAAESTEQKAQVDVQNTAERIRILGGNVDHPTTVLDVTAPVSGTIVEQNIQAAGGVKSLDNSPNLFTIADLSRVWILCDVYENNLAQVHLGDMAEVRLNAYPDRVLKARVSNISRVLDPATRTAKVRLELANTGGMLRPGMFTVAHFYSQGSRDRVVVPATAVLRLHDRDWIFRPVGGNRFRRDSVQAGEATADGRQYILAGVRPGERLVKNALQFSSTVEQ